MHKKYQAFIAGWLNLTFWLGQAIYIIVLILQTLKHVPQNKDEETLDLVILIAYGIALFITMICVIFGILLVHGLHTLKKGSVRAFIIWSRVYLCLSCMVLVRALFMKVELLPLALNIAFLVIYIGIYLVIAARYKSMETEPIPPPTNTQNYENYKSGSGSSV